MPDVKLEAEIIRVFRESHGNYGTRKIKKELAKQNRPIIVSRRKIGEVMKKHGLVSSYIKYRPKQRRTKVNNDPVPNILNREFNRKDELDVVVSDLTYVNVDNRWCYVCLMLDLWNREIIGAAVGNNKDAQLVYDALLSIPYSLDKINIFHTDRGNEFKNKLIDDVVETFHLKRSLSDKGTPLDNAVIESTNHILKVEFSSHYKFKSLEELRMLLAHWIHWYNTKRLHGSLDYVSPIEYRQKHQKLLPRIIFNPLLLRRSNSKIQAASSF